MSKCRWQMTEDRWQTTLLRLIGFAGQADDRKTWTEDFGFF